MIGLFHINEKAEYCLIGIYEDVLEFPEEREAVDQYFNDRVIRVPRNDDIYDDWIDPDKPFGNAATIYRVNGKMEMVCYCPIEINKVFERWVK